jgi:SAM-dependent methyltransferase
MKVYENPLYYEIAFSFFNVKEQVDCFQEIIRRFSRIRVKLFLDIACGPSLQLREIARRGYEAVGLDSSPEMLAYLRGKAEEEGLKIETLQADMYVFRLKRKADFAFIMMGSFNAGSNDELLSHLDSVARSLKKGGLYFIQNMCLDWMQNAEQSWTMERDGINVKTTYSTRWKNLLNQIYTEKLILEVNDHGRMLRLEDEEDLKFVFPQEFKMLVRLNGEFEFLGWWEGTESRWFLDRPLEKAEKPSNINMVLLRRR